MAKIQRNWPQFETLFSLVIYIFSTLCRLTRKDHHVAILWLYLDGHYGYFVKIDHNGPEKNDHNMVISVAYMGASSKKGENIDHL